MVFPTGHLLVLSAAALLAVSAVGAGGFGDYTPPAPNCPAFACPAGQVSVGKPDQQIWSYGCKDSGMNVFNANSFDPNNPYGGFGGAGGGKNLDKCCVERDICRQTCGMTSVECHDSFQKCSKKICKGDQNCNLQAMIADISSEPYDKEETEDPPPKYDPDAAKCKTFARGQSESCACVPEADQKIATEDKLKAFYRTHNSEKLNDDGEIKDVDEVYKKWSNKMPQMFMALATKYKAKAVEMRVKPKAPPYKPPPPRQDSKGSESADVDEEPTSSKSAADQEETPRKKEPAANEDDDDAAFSARREELQAKKRKAAEEEEFESAAELKDELAAQLKAEVERLKGKKSAAIENEDYLEAKRIKKVLAKHEL